MYIAKILNCNLPPTVLLRESYREEGKVKKRTLANLSALPEEQIEVLRRVLEGADADPGGRGLQDQPLEAAWSCGAVLETLKKLGLEGILSTRRHEKRDRVVAMIVARVLEPRSKLATARELDRETLSSSLAEEVGVSSADGDG